MNAQDSEHSGQGLNVEHHFSQKMQSHETTCLKCHKRGNVLVCSNSVCPIVIHKSCMTSMPFFDDSGRFYCPYCLYKQALVEYHCIKEKALLSKRKLVSFLDSKTSRSDNVHQRNFDFLKRKKPDSLTVIEKRENASCTNVECNGVEQPIKVKNGYQSDCCVLETQQAGLRKGHVWEKGIDDENLKKDCLVTEQQVGVSGKEQAQEHHKDDKPDEIGKPHCRMSEGQANLKSQIKATYPNCEDNDSMIDKNSVYPIKEHEETSKVEGKCCALLTTKENEMIKLDELGEEKDTVVEDKTFVSCEMVENSENGDQPHEIVKDRFESVDVINTSVKSLINDIGPTMVDNVALTHELGDLEENQEAKEQLERYHDGMENVGKSPTELQKRQIDNKNVQTDKSDVESYSSVHNECFVRNEFNKDECKRNNEESKQLKRRKFVPPIIGKGSASISIEELDIADDSASSNTNYLDRGIDSGKKEILQNNSRKCIQQGELSGNSGTEVEEFKVEGLGESRRKAKSIKHIKQSTILHAARRRKLPWTVEEVEMLKAGVVRYSKRANKNMSWLKIMEYGRHVFDGTRTPPDLKDKWKNLTSKVDPYF